MEVTARKTHKCTSCKQDIRPGEQYEMFEGRSPRYDDPFLNYSQQIGIMFYRERVCSRCTAAAKEALLEDDGIDEIFTLAQSW